MRKSLVAVAAVLAVVVAVVAVWLNRDGGRLSVHVAVTGCVARDCQTLGLPEVDVTVTFANGSVLTGRTDGTGAAEFDVPDSGEATVRVRSPLLSQEITQRVVPSGEGITVVDIVDPMPVELTRTGGAG